MQNITKAHANNYVQIIFSGVSCDSCLKNNFRGRRYKCLICIDYDLCAACYESGATTNQHTTDHPMQCILSRSDFGEAQFHLYIHSCPTYRFYTAVRLINVFTPSIKVHCGMCTEKICMYDGSHSSHSSRI